MVTPDVSSLTDRKELPLVGLITGEQSEQGSRLGRCGWITSFLRIEMLLSEGRRSKVVYCLIMRVIKNSAFLVAMRSGGTPVPIPNTLFKT